MYVGLPTKQKMMDEIETAFTPEVRERAENAVFNDFSAWCLLNPDKCTKVQDDDEFPKENVDAAADRVVADFDAFISRRKASNI